MGGAQEAASRASASSIDDSKQLRRSVLMFIVCCFFGVYEDKDQPEELGNVFDAHAGLIMSTSP
jgi:hypothetical protein